MPNPNVVFATNSIISQTNAATSGIGLVVLPIFVGSEARALFRVLPDEVVIYRPIWLSVTKDQSELSSIRSAVDNHHGTIFGRSVLFSRSKIRGDLMDFFVAPEILVLSCLEGRTFARAITLVLTRVGEGSPTKEK